MTLPSHDFLLPTPPVRELVIAQYAPDFSERSKTVVKPRLSPQPDELETWETNEILRRTQRMEGESDFGYILRTLYEEMFSAEQPGINGSPIFKGSHAPTIGGFISHYFPNGTINGVGVETLSRLNLKGENLKQVVAAEQNWKMQQGLVSISNAIAGGTFVNAGQYDDAVMKGGPYPVELDTLGLRYIRLLHKVPQLVSPIADQKLLEFAGYKNLPREIPVFQVVHNLWQKFGYTESDIFDKDGFLRHEWEDNKVINGFQNLLYLRTHPELQVLFKYYSPSGFLNEI
ncbi:hypothetical protein HY310_02730 [Candidatus Microgenomates bacterium]|nr:hypothetical protein [Candidatus Microgenomates bacterium]